MVVKAPVGESHSNLEIARNYLRAIEEGQTGEGLGKFFAPDVVFEEFPNQLTPQGKKRNLAESLAGAEKGNKGHVPPDL